MARGIAERASKSNMVMTLKEFNGNFRHFKINVLKVCVNNYRDQLSSFLQIS